MESDNIYKYIGLFIVVVFLLYVVINTLKFQVNVLEGLTMPTKTSKNKNSTDKDKVPEAVKSNTSMMEDALLIDKYTKAYEDTIIDLDSNIDIFILSQVLQNAENISTDPGSDENQKIIAKINAAKAFKDSLNHSIKVLDKK